LENLLSLTTAGPTVAQISAPSPPFTTTAQRFMLTDEQMPF
jgi:hypothetical protein